MKRTLGTIALISVCAVGAYSQSRSGSQSANNATANQEAAKFWSAYVPACGGDHYLRKAPGVFVELKGFRISLALEPLTQSDRLNGLQVKGSSQFVASAHRFFSNGTWHEWQDGMPDDMSLVNHVRFEQRNARWRFYGTGYFDEYAHSVNCGDVPGFRNSAANDIATNRIQIDDYHNFPIENFFFWNSGNHEVGERFAQSSVTYINWKIVYTGTAFDYEPPPVEAVWFKDGKEWDRKPGHFVNTGKGQFVGTKGWRDAGQWETGRYSVKIYVRDQLVRIGTFEIVADQNLPAVLRYDDEGVYNLDIENGAYTLWLRFSRNGTVVYLAIPKTKGNEPWCPNTLNRQVLDIAQQCLSTETIAQSNSCDKCNTRMVGTYILNGSHIEITPKELQYASNTEAAVDLFSGTVVHNGLSLSWHGGTPYKFTFTAARIWVQ